MLSALEIGIGLGLPALVMAHLLMQARPKPERVPVRARRPDARRAPRDR